MPGHHADGWNLLQFCGQIYTSLFPGSCQPPPLFPDVAVLLAGLCLLHFPDERRPVGLSIIADGLEHIRYQGQDYLWRHLPLKSRSWKRPSAVTTRARNRRKSLSLWLINTRALTPWQTPKTIFSAIRCWVGQRVPTGTLLYWEQVYCGVRLPLYAAVLEKQTFFLHIHHNLLLSVLSCDYFSVYFACIFFIHTRFENTHEAIIDQETFDSVQRQRSLCTRITTVQSMVKGQQLLQLLPFSVKEETYKPYSQKKNNSGLFLHLWYVKFLKREVVLKNPTFSHLTRCNSAFSSTLSNFISITAFHNQSR